MMSGDILAIKKHISKLTVKSSLMTVIGGLNKERVNVDSEELKLKDLIIDPVAYTPHKRRFISTGYPNSISRILNVKVSSS